MLRSSPSSLISDQPFYSINVLRRGKEMEQVMELLPFETNRSLSFLGSKSQEGDNTRKRDGSPFNTGCELRCQGWVLYWTLFHVWSSLIHTSSWVSRETSQFRNGEIEVAEFMWITASFTNPEIRRRIENGEMPGRGLQKLLVGVLPKAGSRLATNGQI